MIPRAHITAWRSHAPWPSDGQVEQDLVLTRALVELYSQPAIAESMVFRGGTALHKLFFYPPARYSEDIDLVQSEPEPIGPVIDAIRESLGSWLGEPDRRRGHARVTLVYRFETTAKPVQRMRLKIEVNTSSSVTGRESWFSGEAEIAVYRIEELLGTKLRALYQRRKGRDLYDLWLALSTLEVDPRVVIDCFERYMEHGGTSVSRTEFEENLQAKMRDPSFLEDIAPLLRPDTDYDRFAAEALVREQLISKLRG
ncbi:MAG: nucleotidyl transferase AbiEii/AbiGii toxin family protein [Gemmatimonadota bacterium]